MSRLDKGTVLGDRYRIDEMLGQGGMGSVWRAHHLGLNSPVAVKLIDPSIANNPETIERFMREAQAAAALRSPHVVQTLDYGVHDGVPYIAMELMVGESLASRLDRVGRLSAAETVRILTQIGRAVAKAHDLRIVHRDLKPDNVFLVSNEDEEVAKVLDFGIAKVTVAGLSASSSTRTGTVMGTPYYMSPEQAEGAKAVDHRADVWALGVIAFECITGQRPFEGEALGEVIVKICTKPIPVPSSIAPVVPGFDAWFARACSRDLDHRFPTVRQMMEALRGLVTGAQDQAIASGPAARSRNGPNPATMGPLVSSSPDLPRKSNAPVIGGVLALLAGLAGVAFFALGKAPEIPNESSTATGGTASEGTSNQKLTPEPSPTVVPSTSTATPSPTLVAVPEPVDDEKEEAEESSAPSPKSAPRPHTKRVAPAPARPSAPEKVEEPPPAPTPPPPAAPVAAPAPRLAPKPKPKARDDDYGF